MFLVVPSPDQPGKYALARYDVESIQVVRTFDTEIEATEAAEDANLDDSELVAMDRLPPDMLVSLNLLK